jgi:hypothetical protein
VLRCGVVNERWFPEFEERRNAAARVASAAGVAFVPLQALFDRAVRGGSRRPPAGLPTAFTPPRRDTS